MPRTFSPSRHPLPQSRPTFKDVIFSLLERESAVLRLPSADATTSRQADVLGAPLHEGDAMYSDLQQLHLCEVRPAPPSRHSGTSLNSSDYDHIPKRKYLQNFPTCSAEIDQPYADGGAPRQSYRQFLLTSDVESDFEDIWQSEDEDSV